MKALLRLSIIVVVALVTAVVAAATRKVLVFPTDGDADPALRKQLDAMVARLSRQIDGKLAQGDTTFADAAAAVGCDPNAAGCADTILSTLAVDEIVWGTAKTTRGETKLVVHRATKGNVRDLEVTVDAKNPEASAGTLQPLFGPMLGSAGTGSASGSEPGSGSGSGSGSDTGSGSGSGSDLGLGVGSASEGPPWSKDKKIGLAMIAGGGVFVLVGFAFWANESSLQSDIDKTPTPTTVSDFQSLKALEDKAQGYAVSGDIIVPIGLVAAGIGAYFLWKDHSAHVDAVVPAPTANGSGATLVIGGHF